MELGNLSSRCKGRKLSREPVKFRVPIRGTGAENPVVVLDSLCNGGLAKGVHYSAERINQLKAILG
jgi:hypothetical protein